MSNDDDERLRRAFADGDPQAAATLLRHARRRGVAPPPTDHGSLETLLAGASALNWCPDFTRIEAGSFTMGVPFEASAPEDEQPARQVTLTRPFLLSTTPVTQHHWRVIFEDDPSGMPHPRRPAQRVSWYETIAFCNRLSERLGVAPAYTLRDQRGRPGERSSNPRERWRGRFHASVSWRDPAATGLRLPTEAEWEYAARAGGRHDRRPLPNEAWSAANSLHMLQVVATRKPNPWGLHDTLGGVGEWCWDRFAPYPSMAERDPVGPPRGRLQRVIRGGDWRRDPAEIYPGRRDLLAPHDLADTVGFRLAISLPTTSS